VLWRQYDYPGALPKPGQSDIVGFVALSRIVTIKIAKGSESFIDVPTTSYDLLKIKNYVIIQSFIMMIATLIGITLSVAR
jgi:hypothetical protein